MRSYTFVALLLVALVGCGDSGPSLAKVKGKVTLYGKPYTKGIVTFTPEGGGPVGISTTNTDGDYEIWTTGKMGAVLGKHKVSVTTVHDPAKADTTSTEMSSDDPAYQAQSAGLNTSAYKQADKQKEPIAAKYNKNTELSCEVKSGQNEYNIDIK
jgi:hypothetical protein